MHSNQTWASVPLYNKEFRAIARKNITTAVKFSSLVLSNDLLSIHKKETTETNKKQQQQMTEGIVLVCLILATSLELISVFTQYLQRGKGCH